MSNFISSPRLICLSACIGLAMLAGCGGGGSSTASSGTSSFGLLQANVQPNASWQINRPIQLKFSREVDFASVNLNTISISQAAGGPATGEFHVGTQAGSSPASLIPDATIVVFQPACPKLPDYSDAGLLPGGMNYILDVRAGVNGVRSTSGENLSVEQTILFTTPNSTQASILFMDPQVGPPLPRIYDAASVPPLTTSFSYIELGNDPDPNNGVRFGSPTQPNFGSPAPAGFLSPLNYYSDASSRVVIVLELNQPVNPASTNVSSSNIKLEYLSITPSGDDADASIAGNWNALPHDVSLIANCTSTGARLRITPIGILPQERLVRIVITTDFKDLVGDSNPLAVIVGSFRVSTALDPGTSTPGVAVDEVLESFDVGGNSTASLEDTTSPLAQPRAVWGNGQLSAAFAFGGTGGPGGNFDWQVGDNSSADLVAVTLDTTFTLIINNTQTMTESVINGLVDVHNFTIKPNGRLTIQGPNPCKILASGTVTINGQLIIRGTSNPGVQSFDSTNIAEPGAAGQAGGGKGGAANYLTTQSTPVGEAGFGAFNSPGGGGGGGETGYNGDGIDDHRRPGGGGGGTLGADVIFMASTPSPIHPCPDQSFIGLDAEPGFGGSIQANGTLHPIGTIPAGGATGPRPFFDQDPTNDFWGTLFTQGNQLIQGELVQAWAGAGGGGGGNACDTNTFPTTPFSVIGDEKGAGGGGGGGSLTIFALGDIVIGQTSANPPKGSGFIDASGGTGGGGENTNFLNHVGGASGGGSGGHVILQTASNIDFTRCSSASTPPGGIYALGGQGGQGYVKALGDGGGGAQGGTGTVPFLDALPSNAYPSNSPTTPCPMIAGFPPAPIVYDPLHPNILGNADPVHYIFDGGGDGGPGLIQLHVPDLSNIKSPTTVGQTFYKLIKPPPVGTTIFTMNQLPLGHWDRLLPLFGPKSQAQSKWIPLGAASVAPDSSTPKIVNYFFNGTDPTTGKINTTGAGAQATVVQLPSIFTSALTLHAANSGVPPYVDSDERTIVLDATVTPNGPLGDDIYTRNPSILKQFALKLTQGTNTTTFDVGSATFDASVHQLRVTVSASGIPLHPFAPGTGVDIRPRFFRVTTQGVSDSLPQSPGVGQPGATIKIEFQTTTATATGAPNQDPSAQSLFETDITKLSNLASYPNAVDFRFVRFRVTFDLLDGQGQLTFSIPVPSLEFFRLPFKF